MMKKTTKSIALLLLFTVVITGCIKKESSNGSSGDLAIRLRSGVTSVNPKAAIGTGSVFTAAVAGWEATEGSVNYGDAKTWLSTAEITASATRSEVTLSPVQKYSEDNAIKTHMKAWHPAGTLADDGVVTFGGTADGTVDVLLSVEVVGSSEDAANKTLTFSHPLTQLKFKVYKGGAFANNVTLRSITVKGAQLPTTLNLQTDVVSYATEADLAVTGITAGTTITTSQQVVGAPMMVKPFSGNTFFVDVVTSTATYKNVVVTIDTDLSFVAGRAYAIALYFSTAENVSIDSSVEEWTDGTGSGQIVN